MGLSPGCPLLLGPSVGSTLGSLRLKAGHKRQIFSLLSSPPGCPVCLEYGSIPRVPSEGNTMGPGTPPFATSRLTESLHCLPLRSGEWVDGPWLGNGSRVHGGRDWLNKNGKPAWPGDGCNPLPWMCEFCLWFLRLEGLIRDPHMPPLAYLGIQTNKPGDEIPDSDLGDRLYGK